MAQLPDLTINRPRLAATVELQQATFSSGDCSVIEGCIRAGTRTVLKFDAGFQNVGAGDLVIGDPNARPDLFEASTCHGHFHMRGVAIYELLNGAGAAVVRARKQGWCFRDNEPFSPDAGPGKYTCEDQGISAGWEDIYDKSLDCQWLDVTGLPGGKYVLRVVVNPDRVFRESNYGNNTVSVSIALPGAPQTTTPPPASKPPPPKVQPTQPGKKLENAWKKLKDKFKHKKPKKHKGKGKPKPKMPIAVHDHDDDDGDGNTGDHDKDGN
jgi:lysyl oxidase